MATQQQQEEDAKLERFLQWLQVSGVGLRGCKIKHCDSKGFGIFSSANQASDGVLLIVPLDLAITPMRVLQDSLLGPECRAMFEEGEVDDRYLDMLPTSFGNPLWFPDDELLELKGTTLYRATELQLVGSGGERQPSDTEVRAAVWEACGDSRALQLPFGLLPMKMVDLEKNSGVEDCDIELLKEVNTAES